MAQDSVFSRAASSRRVIAVLAATILLLFPGSLAGQRGDADSAGPRLRLAWRLSERATLLPITTVQWGAPERWSFTGRLVYGLTSVQHGQHLSWSLGVSPGTGGARVHTGILGIHTSRSHRAPAIRWGASAAVLRTWAHPLGAAAYRTYGGMELSGGLPPLLLLGIGRYWPMGAGDAKPFWGVRIGIGI